jgi:hypothetical protein
MKTSGLDVHKDSIFCAIYDGKSYSAVGERYIIFIVFLLQFYIFFYMLINLINKIMFILE